MCTKHYQRWQRYGSVVVRKQIQGDDGERFWSKIKGLDPLGCWEWQDGTDRDGYGKVRVGKSSIRAHRYAYELLIAEIPDGLVLDHLCENRLCVNPWHLEPVTAAINAARAARRTMSRCRRQHLRTLENTWWSAKGYPTCRDCVKITQSAAKRRSVAA